MLSTKYTRDNLNLMNSLVIKLDTIAIAMNEYLKPYGVVAGEKSEWPYYKNLRGQPHSYNSKIFMKSIENNELFEVTTENLNKFIRTKQELMKFGDVFNNLVSNYKGQSLYIRGIICPIDTTKAINAKDGEILYYNKEYVSYNEISLFDDLNKTSIYFVDRWDVQSYGEIEDLYPASLYLTLISHLTKRLFAIRLGNSKTREINEKYIADTLSSTMGVHADSIALTNESKLWLSKNIKFLSHNVGKEFILNTINEKLVKPNGVAMKEVVIRKRSPYNLGITDPEKQNTGKSSDVLRVVDKDNKYNILTDITLDSLNDQSYKLLELKDDYNSSGFKFNKTKKSLEDTKNDERTKFYMLHRNESISFVKSIRSNIMVESIMLYFNAINGVSKDISISIYDEYGVKYEIVGADVSKYLIYSSYKLSGATIPKEEYGQDLLISNSHLLRDDFDIDNVLKNIEQDVSHYKTALINVKKHLKPISKSVSVDEYIAGQLLAHNELVICASLVGTTIQSGQFRSMISCLTMEPTHVLQKSSVEDIMKDTVLSNIYTEFKPSNITKLLSFSTTTVVYDSDKVIKLLESLKSIIISLTSYTVTPLISYSFSDDLIIDNKIGVLEGVSILGNVNAEIRCGVVKPVFKKVSGDDNKSNIFETPTPVLYSTNEVNVNYVTDRPRPKVFVYQNDRYKGFIKEQPILISE